MNLAFEIVKGVGTVVGGTVLVFLAVSAIVLPFMFLADAIKNRGRPRRPPGPSAFGRIRRKMTRAAQPTLLLTPTSTPGFSKLGGDPELPNGFEWPKSYDGKPRPFLAQIDLGALSSGEPEWLPKEGRLYFFWDDATYGFRDLVTVFRSLAPPLATTPPPTGTRRRFTERRVAFEACTSIPSLDWLGEDVSEANLSGAELDELAEAPSAPFGDKRRHRIGGYPDEIQEERMWLSCEHHRRDLPAPEWDAEIPDAIRRAARQWRLLLQLDSDPQLGMNFGGGRLYVFVREQDARKGDFSRTVTLSQTD